MIKSTDERLPLVPRDNVRASKMSAFLLTAWDRMIVSVNMMGFPLTCVDPLLAYPKIYTTAHRFATYVALPLCAGNQALHVMADRDYGSSRNVKEKFSHLEAGVSTFYFFLGYYIAAYIAVYAAVNKTGSKEVDTTDTAYLLGFVAPSALIGLMRIALDATKSSWSESATVRQKFADGAHAVVSTLYSAGTLNEFMLIALASTGIREEGNVDPNLRIGLFTAALVAGAGFEALSRKYSKAIAPVHRLLTTTSAANYLYVACAKHEEFLPDSGRAIVIASFATLGVSALVSAALYPKVQVKEISIRENDVERELPRSGLEVRSESGSEATSYRSMESGVMSLSPASSPPDSPRSVSGSSESVSSESVSSESDMYSLRVIGYSPRSMFSSRSGSPVLTRGQSMPDLKEVDEEQYSDRNRMRSMSC